LYMLHYLWFLSFYKSSFLEGNKDLKEDYEKDFFPLILKGKELLKIY
jgi:hypothetical protein